MIFIQSHINIYQYNKFKEFIVRVLEKKSFQSPPSLRYTFFRMRPNYKFKNNHNKPGKESNTSNKRPSLDIPN
jgi:hypothetical protein